MYRGPRRQAPRRRHVSLTSFSSCPQSQSATQQRDLRPTSLRQTSQYYRNQASRRPSPTSGPFNARREGTATSGHQLTQPSTRQTPNRSRTHRIDRHLYSQHPLISLRGIAHTYASSPVLNMSSQHSPDGGGHCPPKFSK